MSANFKGVDELFAEELVAKLQIEPGKKYLLFIDRAALNEDQIDFVMAWCAENHVEGFMIAVNGKPKDAIVGLEINEKRG